MQSLEKTTPPSSHDSPEGKEPKIEFRDVSFSYSTVSSKMALRSVSFSISSGETIALVGPSGAGKSSSISLLERFFDPSAGKILFQGTDLKTTDVCSLRSRMALVSQEPELFPGSIDHNIRLGAASGQVLSNEQVEKAARKCGLHDFIVSLPEGYNTNCGSLSGTQLSGGQRQRLSLARALIRDPEVLLLDEPTSALDAHSERHVQHSLTEAAKGRTTIIVAHRLASIQHVDRIIVFDQGKVVEQGTHSELVRNGGLYASMARAQALA